MAKKKSKSKDQKLSKASSETGVLGTNLRQVGTAIAGAVIGGVVEAAIDRMTHKSSGKTDKNHASVAPADHSNQPYLHAPDNAVENASVMEKDSIEDAVTAAKDTVQSLIQESALPLPVMADALKELAQNSIQQSINTLESQAMKLEDVNLEGVVDTVKDAVETLNPLKSGKKGKKDKKDKKDKNKGKKNKKNKKS